MKKHNLVIVAHPDDETIFFGGLIQVYRRRPWKVICVTDGNADGLGAKRRQEFEKATHTLRAHKAEMWDFPDKFEQRLNIDQLIARLSQESAVEVFTHGVLGEYGHPHHQDVSLAVHRTFHKKAHVWSTAYNCFADKSFKLPRKAFEKKGDVLSQIYFNETKRFSRWLPLTNYESFTQVTLQEVEALYNYFAQNSPSTPEGLKVYKWFVPYLEEFRRQVKERPF